MKYIRLASSDQLSVYKGICIISNLQGCFTMLFGLVVFEFLITLLLLSIYCCVEKLQAHKSLYKMV